MPLQLPVARSSTANYTLGKEIFPFVCSKVVKSKSPSQGDCLCGGGPGGWVWGGCPQWPEAPLLPTLCPLSCPVGSVPLVTEFISSPAAASDVSLAAGSWHRAHVISRAPFHRQAGVGGHGGRTAHGWCWLNGPLRALSQQRGPGPRRGSSQPAWKDPASLAPHIRPPHPLLSPSPLLPAACPSRAASAPCHSRAMPRLAGSVAALPLAAASCTGAGGSPGGEHPSRP